MNAIASAVNKGSLKVAPKANTARRSRHPSAATKTPLVDNASRSIPLRTTKSTLGSEDDPIPNNIDEARPMTRVVPVVTSTNNAHNKRNHSTKPKSSTYHEADPNTINNVSAEGGRRFSGTSADRSHDLEHSNFQLDSVVNVPRPGLLQDFQLEGSSIYNPDEIVPNLDSTEDRLQLNSLTNDKSESELTTSPLLSKDHSSSSDMKKRKRTTGNTRARHIKREPTPEGAEHEVIDTTGLKMMDLCKDMRQGRKSSKHGEFVRIAAARRRLQRNSRTMDQSRQGQIPDSNHEGEDEDTGSNGTAGAENPEGAVLDVTSSANPEQVQDENRESIENQNDEVSDHDDGPLESSNNAPQVRIVNGQIVLDVNSLQVDRALRDARADNGSIEYVEENPLEKIVNSRSYSKHKLATRWDTESTELFYEGLSQWGTDFDMISRMFPSRDRKQIKNKFTVEERRNPALVTRALIQKKPVDMKEYSRMSDTIFRPVSELEEELADLRSKFELEREEAMKEVAQRKIEMPDNLPQTGNEDSKKKSRRRRADDGLELVGSIEEVEEAARQARQLAADESDDEAT